VVELALGFFVALCVILLVAMLGFGPWVLEWMEGTSDETPPSRPPHGGPRMASRRAAIR
jgi:hypothetical protein